MGRYLAVAHQTAESPEFITAIQDLVRRDPAAELVLLIPATPVSHLATWTEGEAAEVAAQRAEAVQARLRQVGIELSEARVGDHRPLYAILDAIEAEPFDGVLIATFPPGLSRWLATDLIHRLQRSTDLPVTHIIARS